MSDECDFHDQETLICSCGYVKPLDLGGMERPVRKEELDALWNSWPEEKRSDYIELLGVLKPFETEPLQAASLAAGEVMKYPWGEDVVEG